MKNINMYVLQGQFLQRLRVCFVAEARHVVNHSVSRAKHNNLPAAFTAL
jgi:hypothetical protein